MQKKRKYTKKVKKIVEKPDANVLNVPEVRKSEPPPLPGEIISNLVLNGDIRKMTPDEKVKYYTALCHSLKLNPLTQPFQILTLQGRETLYATKTAAEQLRKINGISVEKIEQHIDRDIYITTVIVRDSTGRTDGGVGAVNIKGLSGDQLANAIMKSETKSKRRATLSISGLGMLDESEIETIPDAKLNNFGILKSENNETVMIVKQSDPPPIEVPTIEEMEKVYKGIKEKLQNTDDMKTLTKIIENYKPAILQLIPEMQNELRTIYKNKMNNFKSKVVDPKGEQS